MKDVDEPIALFGREPPTDRAQQGSGDQDRKVRGERTLPRAGGSRARVVSQEAAHTQYQPPRRGAAPPLDPTPTASAMGGQRLTSPGPPRAGAAKEGQGALKAGQLIAGIGKAGPTRPMPSPALARAERSPPARAKDNDFDPRTYDSTTRAGGGAPDTLPDENPRERARGTAPVTRVAGPAREAPSRDPGAAKGPAAPVADVPDAARLRTPQVTRSRVGKPTQRKPGKAPE